MRSKYLEKLASLILSIVFYALLIPLFKFFRDFLGIDNQIVFNIINFAVFLFVYGGVSVLVNILLKKLNNRLLTARKEAGGRDIVAEERHEDEASGLISLSLDDK
jgi:hypothetical protein